MFVIYDPSTPAGRRPFGFIPNAPLDWIGELLSIDTADSPSACVWLVPGTFDPCTGESIL